MSLTPEEKAAIDQHVQAVAKILYRDADKSRMTNLGEIESMIRSQLQEHVAPQVGVFLSQQQPGPGADTFAP